MDGRLRIGAGWLKIGAGWLSQGVGGLKEMITKQSTGSLIEG
jgi:hypothetical protein